MADGYYNNRVATIGNGLVSKISVAVIRNVCFEVYLTERKIKLVGFDHELSNKYTTIEYYTTADIDIHNGSVSDHLDDYTLYQGDVNYLLSKTQYHDFYISVYEAANHHSGNIYIILI